MLVASLRGQRRLRTLTYVRTTPPFPLSQLQKANEPEDCDHFWNEFVVTYSDTVLHTCRMVAHDPDAAMDAYAHALEALREDGCRRLRAYVPKPDVRFSSWLVVVTRRLAHDYFRHRYGRSRSEDAARQQEQTVRRRLEDLVGEKIDPDQLIGEPRAEADAAIRRQQLHLALARAIAELDPADRLLLALRFEDEKSAGEIARVVGLRTVFHVYRRLDRVLSHLRRTLESRGIEGADP